MEYIGVVEGCELIGDRGIGVGKGKGKYVARMGSSLGDQ